ncbi:PD40 domain-containing protein [Rhodanobacter sp. 7MK24]|uniref:TolB family protein n=1 Tax=Rhodanobacter sp. 7MK24 TaxID=2775922 RepID=UPI00178182A8|nr:PD40 domain-containing protein [Rhodanobacter sp. 7MK24]MBD8881731.1 PD40 domain-containing protein [Rhodanobacter sp. 7MK24]
MAFRHRARRPAWILGLCVLLLAPVASASRYADMPTREGLPLPATDPWATTGDASPAFTPDGNTVFFTRSVGMTRSIFVSHRRDGRWSSPELAPFSGQWLDFEPAMSPDGTYLVFVSNRPIHPGGKPLDGYFGGKSRPGHGGNLWMVDIGSPDGHVINQPLRLPMAVNISSATYSPAVDMSNSIYFTNPDPHTHHTRLYASERPDDAFLPAEPLSFSDGIASDYDPAVAADGCFIVFSSNRAPTPPGHSGLFVAYATASGWSRPQPLGILGIEARLGANQHTLYYLADSDERIHQLPLAARLAGHAPSRGAAPWCLPHHD